MNAAVCAVAPRSVWEGWGEGLVLSGDMRYTCTGHQSLAGGAVDSERGGVSRKLPVGTHVQVKAHMHMLWDGCTISSVRGVHVGALHCGCDLASLCDAGSTASLVSS